MTMQSSSFQHKSGHFQPPEGMEQSNLLFSSSYIQRYLGEKHQRSAGMAKVICHFLPAGMTWKNSVLC